MNYSEAAKLVHILWWVWRRRNNMVLGDEVWTMRQVQRQIMSTIPDPAYWTDVDVVPRTAPDFDVPPSGYIALHVDGSFHRPSSVMSCGGFLSDHTGKWIDGFASCEGVGEVFLAELLAIIRGLNLAWRRDIRKLMVHSDCLEVVQALSGTRSLNLYSYAAYLAEARSLLNQEWEVSLHPVPRERNVPADALAKMGYRLRVDYSSWTTPPAEIAPLVGCG